MNPNSATQKAPAVEANKPSAGLSILGLKIDRFMRISAAELTGLPDKGVVIVAGDNGQGKTTTLRAIWCALAGAKEIPAWPIHGDEPKGSIELSLGRVGMPEYKIVRSFKRNKRPELELFRADGEPMDKPQEVLNELIGRLSFNPLAFREMKPKEQQDTLLTITGLAEPLAEMNRRREELFTDRTLLGRDAKNKRGEIANMTLPHGAPEERVDTAALLDQRKKLQEEKSSNDRIRGSLRSIEKAIHGDNDNPDESPGLIREIKGIEDQIIELNGRLAAKRKKLADAEAEQKRIKGVVEFLVDPSFAEIDNEITGASDRNHLYDEAVRYRQAVEKAEQLERDYSNLSNQIDAVDVAKENMLAGANFPVTGLGFSEDGVTFEGIPFEQLAGADQIRISMAVAMRLNPEFKVVLIDDASLLDEEHFGIIREMALENGFQVWCAVVGNRDGAAVVFEAGVAVRGSAVAA